MMHRPRNFQNELTVVHKVILAFESIISLFSALFAINKNPINILTLDLAVSEIHNIQKGEAILITNQHRPYIHMYND